MDKQLDPGGGESLPLASLRLLASPLQLTYSYMWQVLQQRKVTLYGRVEEFVTMVTETVPELMSSKQTAQLLLGLRARVLLELLRKDDQLDSQTIQDLVNKLRVSSSLGKSDPEVEESETNFLALVQNLLKSSAERKRFFQDVFPVQYGSRFNTGLQALVAGLVCKLEQLLPTPNLSQIGTMISTPSSVLEACGHFIPNQKDWKNLLRNEMLKGHIGTIPISPNAGDSVFTTLSYHFVPVFPPDSPKCSEPAQNPASPASLCDQGDVGDDDSCDGPAEGDTSRDSAVPGTNQPADTGGAAAEPNVTVTSDPPLHGEEPAPGPTPSKDKTPLKPIPLKSIPLKVVCVPMKPTASQQNSPAGENADGTPKRPTRRVTLHQWVSQIASNSINLPVLPPLPPMDLNIGLSPNWGTRKTKKQPSRTRTIITCDVCDKKFPSRTHLRDHQRIHSGEKPFTCTACGKAFRTHGFLYNHLKTHSSVRPYTCGQCGRSFHEKSGLAKHMVVHSSQKPFYCIICNKGFTQNGYFKRHMEAHMSKESFPCKHCDKRFPTQFKLENHERSHTRERPHMCEQCGRRFFAPCLLKRHMGYHTGKREYLCSLCGKTFVYLFDLKNHQRRHGPKPTLPCPMCPKKFSSNHCLKVHMRIHTNDRPYKCLLCDKTFTQIGNLTVHKKKHSSERPYSCDQCGNTYKLSTHLRAHKVTHMGEKPWTCGTCGKGFTYPGILKKHEMIHTRESGTTPRRRSCKSKEKKASPKAMYEEDIDDDVSSY